MMTRLLPTLIILFRLTTICVADGLFSSIIVSTLSQYGYVL
jgi:hypothetical protein